MNFTAFLQTRAVITLAVLVAIAAAGALLYINRVGPFKQLTAELPKPEQVQTSQPTPSPEPTPLPAGLQSTLTPTPITPTPITPTPASLAACRITGCSGEVCAEQEIITSCEYKPEYACFTKAKCERQANALCGWTITPEFQTCLQQLSQ